jgi:gliding motility-associated-like protein
VQFFELETAEGATATTPAEPLTLCDAEGDNNGVTVFDLSVLDDEILGGQTNPPYSVTYHETLELAEEGLEPLPTSYTNIINPQEIYATVTNTDSGCSETVVVILNVVQLPFFDLPETFRLCVDENGNPIDEDTGEESPPTFGIDLDEDLFVFEWTLDGAVLEGEIGNTVTAVAGGVYEITATEIATGCSATAMTTVTLSAPPINYSARLVDGAFSGSNTVEILTEGIGTYEYSMDEGPFQDSNIFTDVEAGSRMFTIRDVNGCGEVTFKFGVIDYDRFVTPNADGFNDTWKIESIASFDPTANIYIFDRYGKLLKQLSPLSDGWDGTYNGADMPSSDYWFLIEYTEDDVRKEFRSHFTLKR